MPTDREQVGIAGHQIRHPGRYSGGEDKIVLRVRGYTLYHDGDRRVFSLAPEEADRVHGLPRG